MLPATFNLGLHAYIFVAQLGNVPNLNGTQTLGHAVLTVSLENWRSEQIAQCRKIQG